MRVRLVVRDAGHPRQDSADRDVVVDGEPGTSAAALAAALGAYAPERGLLVDGRQVPPTASVGMPPLLEGAVVSVDPPGPLSGAPAVARDRYAGNGSVWELWVVGGPDTGGRLPLTTGRTVVGRGRDTGAVLTDPAVSRRHAELTVTGSGVTVRDLARTNGTWVGGIDVGSTEHPLRMGDTVVVGSSRLVLRATTRASAHLRPDGAGHLVVTPSTPPPHAAQTAVVFPDQPAAPSRARFPWTTLLVPLALAGLLAAVMRSPTMLLFGLTGPVLSLSSWWTERRRCGARRGRAEAALHAAAVDAAAAELAAATRTELDQLERQHPPLAAVLATAETRSTRLWSAARTAGLDVRLGTGPRRTGIPVEGVNAPDPPLLVDAPVTVDLVAAGVLGVCGERRRAVAAVTALVCRLAVDHGPSRLDLRVLVGSAQDASDWSFATWLPQVSSMSTASGVDALDGASGAGVADLLGRSTVPGLDLPDGSRDRPAQRAPPSARASPSGPAPSRPPVVVVVDGWPACRAVPGLKDLLQGAPGSSVCVVVVDTRREWLPADCTIVLTTDPSGSTLEDDNGDLTRLQLDLPNDAWAPRLARSLAALREESAEGAARGVPDDVRMLDIVAGGDLTAETVRSRWLEAPRSTRAVLGSTSAGPLSVDLRLDGPHALVGGTTGSGKSELLQSLICSLALVNRPDEMTFVLVDYKGGAGVRGLVTLPHVLGVVTDLDAHLTRRALVSLGAEIRRREHLLAAVGVTDLEAYQRLRDRALTTGSHDPADGAGDHLPAVPRIVIVIDEFRVLAEELPDFVPGLVRLAAVGRSLGVHLVLATQRPGGIVTAEMRANVSLRIALRVRDRSDSTDVIESADAAAIPAVTPGRAFLRGATTALTEFQTARVTGARVARARIVVTDASSWWAPVPTPRHTAGRADPDRGAAGEEPNQPDLGIIVTAAREAAEALGIRPLASPWLLPLPASLDIETLPSPPGSVVIGLLDAPADQEQRPWCWRLDGHLGIGGGPRSGRTTVVRTLAGAVAKAFPPHLAHLYLIGPPALVSLDVLPHTAAVAGVYDPDHVALVVDRLRTLVRERRARGSRTSDALLILLVDGWEQLAGTGGGMLAAEVRALLDEGRPYGLRAVVTGGRSVLSGQLVAQLAERLVLKVADPVDLAFAGIPAKAVPVDQPPGRAINAESRHEIQIGLVGGCPAQADQDAALSRIARRWDPGVVLPQRVRLLPDRVSLAHRRGGDLLVVGLREGDLEPEGFDVGQGDRRVVVIGPTASGRTTALVTLAHEVTTSGRPLAVLGRRFGERVTRNVGGAVLFVVDGREPSDRDRLVEARQTHPDLCVLVDDAERLADTPIEPVLREIARLVDDDGGLIALATTPQAAEGHAAPLVSDVVKANTGLLLRPRAGRHLLGVVVPAGASTAWPPGRGLLVTGRSTNRIQVATPDDEVVT